MGTRVEILLWAASGERASELFDVAFAEIDWVDATLSTYRSTSELSRINATASGAAVTVDPEVFGLLEQAVRYSERTGGAFDVAVGPLIDVWRGAGAAGLVPSALDLERARARSGSQLVLLDPGRRTVRFRRAGVELDFGAIGKGWALDRAAAALRRLGVGSALLGAGESSYYAIGAPPGKTGWPITVTDPAGDSVLATVLLHDGSLATSGATRQFVELAGRRYSHIIDPRTGWPVEGMLQVTVTAERATDSDALSTALFVLGPDAARALLDGERGAALFVRDTREGPRVVALRWPRDW